MSRLAVTIAALAATPALADHGDPVSHVVAHPVESAILAAAVIGGGYLLVKAFVK